MGRVLLPCRGLRGGAASGLETVLWGVLVVGLSVALAVAGFALVRRFVPMDLRETHNANTAVIFGALYVMHGLIVGFCAYFAVYQYDKAQRIAEAGSVQELHRLAEGFPDGERQEVQGLAESYARTVVEESWSLMRDGRVGAGAGAISAELRHRVSWPSSLVRRGRTTSTRRLSRSSGSWTRTGLCGSSRPARASLPSWGSC